MPTGEQFAFIIMNRIDAVHHGLVSGENAVRRIIIFFFAEISNRQIRQQIYKTALGLCNKGIAVGKEKNILHPSLVQEHLTQCNNCSGLSRTGSHNKQCFSAILDSEAVTYSLDCTFLIVTTGDGLIDGNILQT